MVLKILLFLVSLAGVFFRLFNTGALVNIVFFVFNKFGKMKPVNLVLFRKSGQNYYFFDIRTAMSSNFIFTILEQTDSTNNDAISGIREGNVIHGQCFFTDRQHSGKGQRGKNWETEPGKGLAMSVAIEKTSAFSPYPFLLHALVSVTCSSFLEEKLRKSVQIKWPNDIYINDRKAGGILIENIFRGKEWRWSVIGIGLNINQTGFPENLPRAVSMRQLTGIEYEVNEMASQLHMTLMEALDSCKNEDLDKWMNLYNRLLYKKNQEVILSLKGKQRQYTIQGVDELGLLQVNDGADVSFSFGEVEWVL